VVAEIVVSRPDERWANRVRGRDIDLDLGENDRAYLLRQSGFRSSLIVPRAVLYVTIWRKRYLDLQLLRVEPSN
jgi:hypothetical protein